MLKNIRMVLLLVALVAIGAAQNEPAKDSSPPVKYYRLDYVVKEIEGGKAINAREYSVIASTTDTAVQSRTGTRLPYRTSPGPGSTQFNYVELGVNLDSSRLKDLGTKLALSISADITSVAGEPDVDSGLGPRLRTTRWSGYVIIPLKKPTVVFSSDDPASKRTIQLQITATPVE